MNQSFQSDDQNTTAGSKQRLQFDAAGEHDTRVLGRHIGRLLTESTVIGLTGTLGAGKTRLTKAIAEGLEIDASNVNSPTFTLSVPHYGRIPLLHVDAYRLASLSEVDQLGLDEWVDDGGILIVEWADKIKQVMPPADLVIHVESLDASQRRFSIEARSSRTSRLVQELDDLTREDQARA